MLFVVTFPEGMNPNHKVNLLNSKVLMHTQGVPKNCAMLNGHAHSTTGTIFFGVTLYLSLHGKSSGSGSAGEDTSNVEPGGSIEL